MNDYKFMINYNGSIQHGNVEYKEYGDTLINVKNISYEAAGDYKYSITEAAESLPVLDSSLLYVNLDAHVIIEQ